MTYRERREEFQAKDIGKGISNAGKAVGKGLQKVNPLNPLKDLWQKAKYFVSFLCCLGVVYCLYNFGVFQMTFALFSSAVSRFKKRPPMENPPMANVTPGIGPDQYMPYGAMPGAGMPVTSLTPTVTPTSFDAVGTTA